jgi:hypothetical protein
MNNPWLTIPLEDYEGHMAMPDVGKPKCSRTSSKSY